MCLGVPRANSYGGPAHPQEHEEVTHEDVHLPLLRMIAPNHRSPASDLESPASRSRSTILNRKLGSSCLHDIVTSYMSALVIRPVVQLNFGVTIFEAPLFPLHRRPKAWRQSPNLKSTPAAGLKLRFLGLHLQQRVMVDANERTN